MSRAAVDTGGTFTDVVSVSDSGRLQVHKLLSTPDDPGRALRDGVAVVAPEGVAELVHGTTVATNALLERTGSRAGLITTAGFESLLELGRQARPDLYALHVKVAPALIPRDLTFGLRERLDHRGQVVQDLADKEIDRALAWVREERLESVAICLLHSYANSAHESRLARTLLAQLPQVHVSVSSELVPEFREYERASTTAVNAFVGPIMRDYLERLESEAAAESLDVFLSSGGRAPVSEAAKFPVHTVLSGPAGGVVGAMKAASDLGIRRVITFDMGGTSTDVSLANGEPTIARDAFVGANPVTVPVIDIETVGAGGGSIGWRDAGGALRVGPRSAGAEPGPACYGNGGTRPTVTDAHVVLGRLQPECFLGGTMKLDVAAAWTAVEGLANELELDALETAEGILAIADAAMVRAIKVVSLERGFDPADFTLVSFGGAGGLHAIRLAEALDIRQILVPRYPGLLSAWGMLQAAQQFTSSRSVMCSSSDRATILAAARLLLKQGDARIPGADLELRAALRYRGQSFEIEVSIEADVDVSQMETDFHREHERQFGYRAEREIECTAIRLNARGTASEVSAHADLPTARTAHVAQVVYEGTSSQFRVVDRSELQDGEVFSGPMIVTEMSGTTVVAPGWRGRVEKGHLILERS